jgi:hypothetical protein
MTTDECTDRDPDRRMTRKDVNLDVSSSSRDVEAVERKRRAEISSGSMLQAMPSRQDLEQVAKINTRVAAAYEVLLATYLNLKDAYDRSPYDISPCCVCGQPVVCLPDGIPPMCEECWKKQAVKDLTAAALAIGGVELPDGRVDMSKATFPQGDIPDVNTCVDRFLPRGGCHYWPVDESGQHYTGKVTQEYSGYSVGDLNCDDASVTVWTGHGEAIDKRLAEHIVSALNAFTLYRSADFSALNQQEPAK